MTLTPALRRWIMDGVSRIYLQLTMSLSCSFIVFVPSPSQTPLQWSVSSMTWLCWLILSGFTCRSCHVPSSHLCSTASWSTLLRVSCRTETNYNTAICSQSIRDERVICDPSHQIRFKVAFWVICVCSAFFFFSSHSCIRTLCRLLDARFITVSCPYVSIATGRVCLLGGRWKTQRESLNKDSMT